MSKTAIVFGSSGLIGSELLPQLFADPDYDLVIAFVRKPTGIVAAKLEEVITDFKDIDALRSQVKGDVVYCCLGTTIKTAGTEAAFRKVDYELVRWAAVAAAENKVSRFIVVSSMGANADSGNFYLRTKGEMEKAVSALNFSQCVIVRPSMLLGPRKEFRFGEKVGKVVMIAFSFLIPSKYKAIQAKQVAKAMIATVRENHKSGIIENAELLKF
jgi:uncharacterized protein YbjT (DUF2867 family)